MSKSVAGGTTPPIMTGTRLTEADWDAATDELFEALGEGYGITRDHAKGLAFRVLTAVHHPAMRALRAAPPGEPPNKLILQNARSAIEAAQEVIGQCDCIMAEDSRHDPKRLWREARDAYLAVVRGGEGREPSKVPTPSEKALVAGLIAYERFGVALSDSGLFRKIQEMGKAMYAVDFGVSTPREGETHT